MSLPNTEFSPKKDESIIVYDNLVESKNNNNNNSNAILNLERKINLAKGQEKVDLLVKNAKIVNVFSGEIHQADVAIADGIFVGFGGEGGEEYDTKNLYDAQGRYMSPGLIDGHIHVESTFLSPREFCNVVAPHGTSAVICDPHEIANVLGLNGIDYLLQSSLGLSVKFYFMMPSCVPATQMETSGAAILDKDIREYIDRYPELVIGLAEMMNYPGVISEDKEILSKLIAVGSRPKDGHAPLLSGKSLNAYIIAGMGSDHECTNLKEAIEKLRKGMHIMIRQGTHEKNLQDLIPLINDFNSFAVSLVSDDRDPIDLKENGHLDYLVRTAISFGLPPIRAIQMASINTARYFGLNNIGAIAPGFMADFILLDDLESFRISEVFLGGKRIDNGYVNRIKNEADFVLNSNNNNSSSSSSSSSFLQNTMYIKSISDSNMFVIPTNSTTTSSCLQVIGVIPGQIITEKRIIPAKIDKKYGAVADTQRDLAKLAVIERHHRTGNIGLGFVQGLGLERGAIASSVAHDSHNIVVAGMNDNDMLIAVRYISSIGGGLAVAENGYITANLPLPIAGLMSNQSIESVISNLTGLNQACLKLGNNVIKDPFMLLSFLSLSVIPSLKLTDKGLVDVDKFRFTSLWAD
ncbi:MAG TPA: adenine deaminase [Nitrososphaeraceae archaeon]|nr:adenine deaminase [Nitrososphaeraceae archaeon]